ncbi:MAG: ABC transporter permease [Treponema sp.]|jgi:ribose transport system permease protein|nr:ABC transporter permease [Treponema sp.]
MSLKLSPAALGKAALRNMVYILCVVLLVIPGMIFPGYASSASITVLLKNISLWGIMAIGVAFVMLLGCNDLSIGLNVSMLTVFTALLGQRMNLPFLIPSVCILGVAAGLFNGFVVGQLNINPFIATLGTQLVFKGIGMVLSNGYPIMNTNPGIKVLFEMPLFHAGVFTFTLPMAVMAGCLLIASCVLKYTRFGQNVYVVGGNREAAALAGISPKRIILACYAISGLSAGITAILVTSFNTSGNAAIGERYSLMTVAACVMGGLSMSGGYGSAVRAVMGVAAMQLIQKVLYRLDPGIASLQIGIIGMLLIIFMIVDLVASKLSGGKQ